MTNTYRFRRGSAMLAALLVTSILGLDVGDAGAATTAPDTGTSTPGQRAGIGDPVLRSLAERTGDPRTNSLLAPARVEVETDPGFAAEAAIERLGGRVTVRFSDIRVAATIPLDRLEDLQSLAGVRFVQSPTIVNLPGAETRVRGTNGQETTAKTATNAWHDAGFTGAGVKVGIIDSFNRPAWTAGVSAGELPEPAGTVCRSGGTDCGTRLWEGGTHGVSVAEVIHDQAPDAQLFLVSAYEAADLRLAIDWLAANGVTVVSRSLTALYDGPGNGTGAMADVIDYAVSKGMTWFNSAGNNAGVQGQRGGSYWRGLFRDVDGNNWMEFSNGTELFPFVCQGMFNGIRWDDLGATRTDYDVFVYDTPADAAQDNWVYKADSYQSTQPARETRFVDRQGRVVSACDSTPARRDDDVLSIKLFAPGNGTSDDTIEIMANMAEFEMWTNAGSASGPAADTKSPGAVVVGAVDPALGASIAKYSSQGPTNDGRIKPDLSAAACVSSYTDRTSSVRTENGRGCFNGTSAATPVAAGAAAVVLSAYPTTTPTQMRTWLLGQATTDRGTPGTDNVFGRGELTLPAPPVVAQPQPQPAPAPQPAAVAPPQPAVVTPAPQPAHAPWGRLDGAWAWGSTWVMVGGWAIDFNTPSDATQVHLYVNGNLSKVIPADRFNPLLGNHAFADLLFAPGPRVTVCAYAINTGPPSPNTFMGCSTVDRKPARRARPAPRRRARR